MALSLKRIIGTITGKVAFERTDENFQEIQTEVNNKLNTSHNTNSTAHQDIRQEINDLDADVVAHKAESVSEVMMIEEPYNQSEKTTINLGYRPDLVEIIALIRNTRYMSNGRRGEGNHSTMSTLGTSSYDIVNGAGIYFYENISNLIRGNISILSTGFEINWIVTGDPKGASGTRRLMVKVLKHGRGGAV